MFFNPDSTVEVNIALDLQKRTFSRSKQLSPHKYEQGSYSLAQFI